MEGVQILTGGGAPSENFAGGAVVLRYASACYPHVFYAQIGPLQLGVVVVILYIILLRDEFYFKVKVSCK